MSRSNYSASNYSIIPLRRTISAHQPNANRDLPNFYSVIFHDEVIHVTVAKKAAHVNQWISRICRVHCRCPHCKLIVGLDTEWRPSFVRGQEHDVAILQICVGQQCLIYQLLHTDCIPASLHEFLADPQHTFYGVGVREDVRKLFRSHGLAVKNITDLNELINGEDEDEYKPIGLKKMASTVLGKEMMKPLRVTLSKWHSLNLSFAQIEYAAIDAFVSFQIAVSLCSSTVN
ncbi:Werner Syndrome-like exonuclease [Sesamum indicum]|uniref:Werner Syndrome-like exonuclease n=1 Tax=Sesamum indicum TaxID=4182 RepID=A0A6I9U8H3_SESIN|nr:Werner Syndrome-like exonuclease [Sesamum indicum]